MRLIDASALNGYKFGLISPYAQNLFHKIINEAPTIDYKRLLEQEPCEDCISRQAVLDKEVYTETSDGWTGWTVDVDDIKALPPVTPQYTEAEIQKMQELEQAEIQKAYELGKAEMQPCEDSISRDKAIVQLSHLLSDWDDDWNVAIRKCIETVKIVPPVKPAEKVGHWITVDKGLMVTSYKCSECGSIVKDDTGYDVTKDYSYCHCGAKMGGEQNETDRWRVACKRICKRTV